VLREAVDPVLRYDARQAIDEALARDRSRGQMLRYSHRTFCPELRSHRIMRDLYRESGLSSLVDGYFGPGAIAPPDAQIALRFPEHRTDPVVPSFHLDGLPNEHNGVPGLFRETALLGVYLSRTEQPEMGNLVVWPGSHRLMAEHLRRNELARRWESVGPDRARRLIALVRDAELGPGTQLLLEPGDAVLAHGALAHGIASNLSLHVRYAVYFRLYHRDDNPADLRPWLEPDRFFPPRPR
jgi:hypothetical protein